MKWSPCPECFDSTRDPRPFPDEELQGRNTLRLIPRLRSLGVDESVLDRLIDWWGSMWIVPNRDSLRR